MSGRRARGHRAAIGQRAEQAWGHAYYDGGLRYQIAVRGRGGEEVPLIDGGTFEWVAKLTSNRRAVFVASGLGTQLVPVLFRRAIEHENTKSDS